jgi:hypothetical protein
MRLNSFAPTATPQLIENPAEAQPIAFALRLVFVAWALITLAVGVTWCLLANDCSWRIWRVALLSGLAPVVVASLMFAFASSRHLLNVIEDLIGYDLNGDGAIGDNSRIIPVYREKRPTVDGVDADDLRDFVRAVSVTRNWTQNSWRGRKMPSGRVCDNGYHAAIMAVLCNAGIVADYGPRRKGRLAIEDADQALRMLNL